MSAKANTSSKRPTYGEMIREAIIVLKDRKGSSRQAIKKYISNTYNIEDNSVFNSSFRKALNKGVDNGMFEFVNGPMGTIKLVKKETDKKKVEKPKAASKADESSKRAKMKVPKSKTTKKTPTVKDKKRVSKTRAVKKPSTSKTPKKTSTVRRSSTRTTRSSGKK
ncbi:22988_t:CDS:1 [Dentiscutata erythropus]|uniref:Histone H1 n=1 Tax=Dentiscutata erythropus TaxID=1348616 RepID=A0A9N9DKJ6_9GLOM|nr:22988_t:CDS:1 [Dentiscutata erythropus]